MDFIRGIVSTGVEFQYLSISTHAQSLSSITSALDLGL